MTGFLEESMPVLTETIREEGEGEASGLNIAKTHNETKPSMSRVFRDYIISPARDLTSPSTKRQDGKQNFNLRANKIFANFSSSKPTFNNPKLITIAPRWQHPVQIT